MNIVKKLKKYFVSRRVICNVPGSYPLWERSEKLLCRELRNDIERYDGNGKRKRNWIAREFDPCPKCDHPTCHNRGKEFHGIADGRLTIEKAHCI